MQATPLWGLLHAAPTDPIYLVIEGLLLVGYPNPQPHPLLLLLLSPRLYWGWLLLCCLVHYHYHVMHVVGLLHCEGVVCAVYRECVLWNSGYALVNMYTCVSMTCVVVP